MPPETPLKFSAKNKSFNIAIVGRPNVGKSTLFNKLCSKQKAIVAKEPGVTRDFQLEKIYWKSYAFHIVDTSGFEMNEGSLTQHLELHTAIDQQRDRILRQSQAYLFVCDGQEPLTQLDHELLQKVRKENKPLIPVVNKIDTTYFKKHESEFYEFLGTSFQKLSAEKGIGLTSLLETLEQTLILPKEEETLASPLTKVVIMGRPNVGKSTLMNQLLSEERVVVSPVPGTTRDSIDSEIEWNNRKYLFIDTAGLRKKRKITEKIEKLATQSALKSLERADILLLVIDAGEGPTEQDIQITKLAWERGVAVILLINKWDLLPMEKRTNTYWQKVLWNKFRHFNRIPFLFISALEKRNISKIFEALSETKTFYERVIDPKKGNEAFLKWTGKAPHPLVKVNAFRHKMKFFSARQVQNAPPVFEVKTSHPKNVATLYDRYLKNKFRETHGFWGIPIEIVYQGIGAVKNYR
ncbi:MAG: ribosome biogenesis GTPase Der [Deltaproteobacteria bacterium]|nr:ribosome biogenesis GTPase Der [Deltaproteobacteria bacterium]